jgi:hypothetical protein
MSDYKSVIALTGDGRYMHAMHFAVSPDESFLARVAQFTVPLAAVEAIDVAGVIRAASEDGVDKAHVLLATTGAERQRVVVTCQLAMTLAASLHLG